MARIRTIKPEFWTSEQIVECSPNARLLFIGLMNFADDNGVHPLKPMRIKMEIFPGDAFSGADVNGFIGELVGAGLLVTYTVDGEEYARITGFHKHQKIDQPSYKYPLENGKIPENPKRRRSANAQGENGECSANTSGVNGEGSPPEGNGKEGKGSKPPKSPKGDGYRFTEFWEAYPKRQGKGNALKAWRKINPDDQLVDRILSAVRIQRASRDWTKDDGQFIPLPATWLNGQRWEDEVPGATPANQPVRLHPLLGGKS